MLMKSKIKIMLVEDHPKYRKVIEMALADDPDMEVVDIFGAACLLVITAPLTGIF